MSLSVVVVNVLIVVVGIVGGQQQSEASALELVCYGVENRRLREGKANTEIDTAGAPVNRLMCELLLSDTLPLFQ